MDDEGYVNIVGRIKDMIIRGGENVYPREIEEFLYTHPDVVDVQVIGVPDERYGEEIMAWVQLRDGAVRSTATSLREFCRGQHRPLQGAALRQVRRRVPHDGHRQDPEVQDARAGDRAARPTGRRLGANGVTTTSSSVTFLPLILAVLVLAGLAAIVVAGLMSNRASALAAGWYPDPYGQSALRFWDGRGWTGHTA